MQPIRTIVSVLVFSLALISCGTTTSGSDPIDAFSVLTAGDLSATKSGISGTTGAVLFTSLTGQSAKNSFKVSFTLTDGGFLKLIANASEELTSGIKVKFTRTGNVLGVFLETNSGSTDVSSKFADVSAAGLLTFQIDIHNDEAPAHIMIWDGTKTTFTEATARLNSEDGYASPGQGAGNRWGLSVGGATATLAQKGPAKVPEDAR